MAPDSVSTQFDKLRRPLLIQRVVLTLIVSGLVVILPLGPNRIHLAVTIIGMQAVGSFFIERRRLELIDQLGSYLVVEHLIVAIAGVICPASYVAASMLAIASVGINAPYLTVKWLRRITPVTVAATIIAPLVHDIDGALPIICISTLLCLHMTFNRSGAVLLAEDAMAKAQYQADHDPLTGLSNRRVLVNRLDELDTGTEFGLLLIDLNDFKEINDRFGHEVGDRALRWVADRLTGLDDSILALRLGGDEFAVTVPGPASETERIADLVLAGLTGTIDVGGTEIQMGASVGMAHTSTASPHELLLFADLAMFGVKRAGGSRAWYSSDEVPVADGTDRRARRDLPLGSDIQP